MARGIAKRSSGSVTSSRFDATDGARHALTNVGKKNKAIHGALWTTTSIDGNGNNSDVGVECDLADAQRLMSPIRRQKPSTMFDPPLRFQRRHVKG